MPVIQITQHPSNTKRRKRKGRGISSGMGKTSGRGMMGIKSRSGGGNHPRFEGGQNPMIRHFPKLGGFKHHSKIYYHPINLADLADAAEGDTVDLAYLDQRSLLPKKRRGMKVKLLGTGDAPMKLKFQLHKFSHQAQKKVEAAGGTCEEI